MKTPSKFSSLLLTAALAVAFAGSGCTSDQNPLFGQTTATATAGTTTGTTTTTGGTGTTTGGSSTGGSTTTTGGLSVPNNTQVEQLARPAIAEGLLYTNANLNTYNAVPPSFVYTALTQPSSPQAAAALPVFTEAEGTLGLLVALAPPSNPNPPTVAGIAAAFLPDVMRIDTTLNLEPTAGTEVQAYAHLNSKGMLIGGRKLTDDVMDDTFTVLTGGGVTTDNVPYYKPTTGAGATNPSIGHQNLNGQTAQYGPSTFPFLAPAN